MKKIYLIILILFCINTYTEAQDSFVGFNYGYGVTNVFFIGDTSIVSPKPIQKGINGFLRINLSHISKSNIVTAVTLTSRNYSFDSRHYYENPFSNTNTGEFYYRHQYYYYDGSFLFGYNFKLKKRVQLKFIIGFNYNKLIDSNRYKRIQNEYVGYHNKNATDIGKLNTTNTFGYTVESEFTTIIYGNAYISYGFTYNKFLESFNLENENSELEIKFSNLSGFIGMKFLI